MGRFEGKSYRKITKDDIIYFMNKLDYPIDPESIFIIYDDIQDEYSFKEN